MTNDFQTDITTRIETLDIGIQEATTHLQAGNIREALTLLYSLLESDHLVSGTPLFTSQHSYDCPIYRRILLYRTYLSRRQR